MPDKKCCVDGCDLSTPGNWTKKAILLFLELWGERYGLLNGDTDLDGKHIHEIFVDMGKHETNKTWNNFKKNIAYFDKL